MQKVSNAFQERIQKKATDATTKLQLKKMVDEMEKEMGLLSVVLSPILLQSNTFYINSSNDLSTLEDMLNIFSNIKNGRSVDIPDVKPKDNNLKYDKLLKEHEQLKEKLESAVKELASEKEKSKVPSNVKVEDTKNLELQNGRSIII